MGFLVQRSVPQSGLLFNKTFYEPTLFCVLSVTWRICDLSVSAGHDMIGIQLPIDEGLHLLIDDSLICMNERSRKIWLAG